MSLSSSAGWTSRPWKAISIRSTLIREGHPTCVLLQKREGVGTRGWQSDRRGSLIKPCSKRVRAENWPAALMVISLGLGTFSPDTVERTRNLHTGAPLSSFESGGQMRENVRSPTSSRDSFPLQTGAPLRQQSDRADL